MSNVKDSSVIITNPTHIAVALRYKQGEDMAPKLMAKGKRVVISRILGNIENCKTSVENIVIRSIITEIVILTAMSISKIKGGIGIIIISTIQIIPAATPISIKSFLLNPRAVALRYKQGEDMAPKLMAKGINHVAYRIKEIAHLTSCFVILSFFLWRNFSIVKSTTPITPTTTKILIKMDIKSGTINE